MGKIKRSFPPFYFFQGQNVKSGMSQHCVVPLRILEPGAHTILMVGTHPPSLRVLSKVSLDIWMFPHDISACHLRKNSL